MLHNLRVNHAIQFATMAHGNQMRKGSNPVPYIFHPFDVANEILFYSGLEGEELELAVILGLLHDTVEDTVVTAEDVKVQFGDIIAAGVLALSKDDSLPKPEQFSENLARIENASRSVQVTKLADRTSNLKSFPAMWDRGKITSYVDEAIVIARKLGNASETLSARLLMRATDTRNRLSLRSH